MKWVVCGVLAYVVALLFDYFDFSAAAMVAGVYFVILVNWWKADDRFKKLERTRHD